MNREDRVKMPPVNEQATLKDFNDVSGNMGKRIAVFRAIMGLTNQQLARELEFDENQLANLELEQEEINPDFQLLFTEKLYHYYGINVNWLISGSGAMFNMQGPLVPKEIFEKYNLKSPNPKYYDLLEQMNNDPIIEQLVLAKFEEAKSMSAALKKANLEKEAQVQ